jgi:hypothetical protein
LIGRDAVAKWVLVRALAMIARGKTPRQSDIGAVIDQYARDLLMMPGLPEDYRRAATAALDIDPALDAL